MWILITIITGIVVGVLLPLYLLPYWASIPLIVGFHLLRLPKLNLFRGSRLWQPLRDYLSLSIVHTDPENLSLTEETSIVYACAPHGPFCLALIALFATFSRNHSVNAEGKTIPLVARQLLFLPLLGPVTQLLGCASFSRFNYHYLLKQHSTLAIAPGGTREMGLSQFCTDDEIHILRRATPKWLISAYRHNATVVPILSIGETQAYDIRHSPSRLQALCQRVFGYPFPIFAFGRWGTFWPKKITLTVALGRPIVAQTMTQREYIGMYYREMEEMAEKFDKTIIWISHGHREFGVSI